MSLYPLFLYVPRRLSALGKKTHWTLDSFDCGYKKQVGFVHCILFYSLICSLHQVIRAFKVNSGVMRKCKL